MLPLANCTNVSKKQEVYMSATDEELSAKVCEHLEVSPHKSTRRLSLETNVLRSS